MAHPSAFSESCEREVDAAITRACDEALSVAVDESRFLAPYMTMHDVADHVLALVRRSIAAFSNTQNTRSLILRMLPAEILCDILMHLPLSDCIRATHVCRKLRDILLTGSGLLWSRDLSFSSPPGMLGALLERSAYSNVTLTGSVTLSNWAETARCLEKHLHRCTLLYIDLDELLPADGQLAITHALCCSSAPRLHSLRFHDTYCQFNSSLDTDHRLFNGDAPNLALVKIFADLRSISPNISFPSVKWLLFSSSRSSPSMNDIRTVYERFPRVEAVSMELGEWADDNEAPPLFPRDSTFNIILHMLRIITDARVVALVSRLESRNAGRNVDFLVSYNLPERDRAGAILALANWVPPSGNVCSAMIVLDPLFSNDLMATIFLERAALLPAGDSISARLVVFAISESVLAMDIVWPEMPALEVLSITLGCPIGDRAAEVASDSMFILPRGRPRLLCPALRELNLIVPVSQHPLFRMDTMLLDPALVAEFIDQHLHFGNGQSPSIVLHNARFLENRAADVACLLSRVAMLDVAQEGHAVVLTDAKCTPTPESYNRESIFLIRDWS